MYAQRRQVSRDTLPTLSAGDLAGPGRLDPLCSDLPGYMFRRGAYYPYYVRRICQIYFPECSVSTRRTWMVAETVALKPGEGSSLRNRVYCSSRMFLSVRAVEKYRLWS